MEYFAWVITLIIINIVCFFIFIYLYKRSVRAEMIIVQSKTKQLEKMLDNADQMIDELNRLADYVAVRIEEENTKLLRTITDLDEKVKSVFEVDGSLSNKIGEANSLIEHLNQLQEKLGNISCNSTENGSTTYISNPKYIEILRMAENGISVREIAKKLNVGQGEVQLLLGIKK
ncbi:MAG: hypothetical protein PWR27_18 [Petroclostridium sp.]|nr:hypothetical protein [Clostridia bacterium]MDK2809309.1 hypothetical protein [Petroclostridium sp.]